MVAGLFFSWAGDVVLEFSKNNGNIFILGLACFLLAHIMYLTLFFITPGKNSILSNRIWLLIPVLTYGVVLVSYLYYDLAEMRLPVIMYAIVILTMLAGAINRKEKVKKNSYYLVLTGAILFVISDSAIAINKFSHQFESSGIVIMLTYIVAQYLIVEGYICQFSNLTPDQITR
jgi:Predicted membrane protein